MNLLKKLFNKKTEEKEPTCLKGDVFIYAEDMQEPYIREDKAYVIAGVYNEDKTQFTDLLNDKVYTFNVPLEEADVINFTGKKMFKVGNSISREIEDKIWGVIRLKTNTSYEENGFAWVGSMNVGLLYRSEFLDGWVYVPERKEFGLYLDFLYSCKDDKVKLSQIKKIGNALNNYAYEQVLKEFEKDNIKTK